MLVNDRIVEKIQKLLSLANSSNEHEAMLASERAQALLVKHNLALQDVKDAKLDYREHVVSRAGHRISGYQKMVCSLMADYFFVRPIVKSTAKAAHSVSTIYGQQYSRRTFSREILFLGTAENVKIAGYVYSFLCDAYPKLWQRYREDTGALDRSRSSYYQGLTLGISKALKDARWRVQEETGLVLVGDKKLDEFVESRCSGNYKQDQQREIDEEALREGYRKGKDLKLRKGVESTSEASGLAIAHEGSV